MSYVELHARSAFSFLEGASVPEELIAAALQLQMPAMALLDREDRKSTRLNSSHLVISYAVFCLKKKKPVHGRRGSRHAARRASPARAWSARASGGTSRPLRCPISISELTCSPTPHPYGLQYSAA